MTIVAPPNITDIQMYKAFQKFICFHVVCKVYGSGIICRVEGKYEKVHEEYNKLLQKFINKTDLFEDWIEHAADQYTAEQMRSDAKGKPMKGTQIWGKGIAMRRETIDLCSGSLGKVLRFKTIKPPSDTESDCKVEEADFGLVEEFVSSGTEDLALALLLEKVFICKACRQIYYYYHYCYYLYICFNYRNLINHHHYYLQDYGYFFALKSNPTLDLVGEEDDKENLPI
jgi:hypothetical protein